MEVHEILWTEQIGEELGKCVTMLPTSAWLLATVPLFLGASIKNNLISGWTSPWMLVKQCETVTQCGQNLEGNNRRIK